MRANSILVIGLYLLVSFTAWPQQYHGYDFTTGVDASKWITIDDTVPAIFISPSSWVSGNIALDFPFQYTGQEFNFVMVHRNGVLILGNYAYNTAFPQVPVGNQGVNLNLMMPYSTSAYWDSDSSWVKYRSVITPDGRTAVFEFKMKKKNASTTYLHWQVQLNEEYQSFLFIYAPSNDPLQGPLGQTGWLSGSDYVLVNTLSHTAEADGNASASPLFWPGNWRWYSFKPHTLPCLNIDSLHVNTERYSARAEWNRHRCHNYYIVEYGAGGFTRGSGTRTLTYNNWIDIFDLIPGAQYDVYVTPVCDDTVGEVISTTFITSCSNMSFTNLYASNVICRTGTVAYPSTEIQVVDNGSNEVSSRHTIHYDTSERDPRASNILRTIPYGHCMSVRLGNWQNGSGEEDISYILQVDTNEHDLLILRYAIVEDNPNHTQEQQPHFTLSIKDTAGNLIDQCAYANFVSGDMSGWIESTTQANVVWQDWSAMGIDLARYHGQRIIVQLSNYDCSLGGHWGYAYYTLEWGTKHLVASNCGAVTENTYRAPQGFNYRWYSDNNQSVTLSTADTLHVSASGSYGCHVSYRLMDNDCGFEMHTRAGTRYPLARFVSTSLDSCGSLRRFTSRSVVTTDAARTRLTDEPCEQYLWRFDDGTTDTLDRVTHRFTAGTHTVTLVAMLGGGTCRDSVSQTFNVDIPSDTIYTTVCPGTLVSIGNHLADDTGTYVYVQDCMEHVKHISWYEIYNTYIYDTVCDGGEVEVGNNHYDSTGIYLLNILPDRHGCDSSVYLHFTVMDREQDSVIYDTLCNGEELPYYGSVYNSTGEYVIDTLRWVHGCPVAHVLNLTVLPTYHNTIVDTAVCGTHYPFADTLLFVPGVHVIPLLTMMGCDSLFLLRLNCTDTLDTTVCISTLPFEWDSIPIDHAGNYTARHLSHDGTDSVIEFVVHVRDVAVPQVEEHQACHPESHNVVTLTGYRLYDWNTKPYNPDAVDSTADSLLQVRIKPKVATQLMLHADWPDGVSCPWTDTLLLLPSALFRLGLHVTPEFLTPDNMLLRATETGQGVTERYWFIDSVLQQEGGQLFEYEAEPTVDSVLVTLAGSNDDCADTLSHIIYVRKHSLWFPNVFTPDEEINKLFRAYGTGVVDFELWVYDRRGVLMFHTTDMEQGWDGTSDGIRCRQEAYAYTCRYTAVTGGQQIHTGTVTLLR